MVAVSGATPGAASVMRVGTSVGGAGRHIMAAGATRERSPRLVPPPPSVARSSAPARAPARRCTTRGAIIDAVDGFGPSTYGDAFADIYDDWYADLSDLDACVDALVGLADGGPGGGDRRRHGSGRRPAGRTRCPRRRRRREPPDARTARRSGGRGTCAACGPTPRAPPPPGGWCRVVYAAYNTFWSIGGPDEQAACLAAAARCLHPRGRVVLEGFVPGASPDRPSSSVEVTRMTTDSLVLLADREDPARQELEGQHVHISDAGIRLRPWRVRYLTNDQLDDLAGQAGLELDARWGSWDGRPLADDDAVAISVYRCART